RRRRPVRQAQTACAQTELRDWRAKPVRWPQGGGANPPSGCSLQDHQPYPQPNELRERDRQRAQAEELRLPMQPGIVVYSDLRHHAAAQFQFAHQLDADGSAGGSEVNSVQQLAPNQTVVAVDVADPNAEEQARAEVVEVTDPDAVSRVVALQLVTVDESGFRCRERQQAGQFADVVLAVAICIENKLPG